MIRVIGLGAGGHAKVVIEALQLTGGFDLAGMLDPKPEMADQRVLSVPVIGDDSMLPDLYTQGVRHAFIGLGGTGDNGPRTALYNKAASHGFDVISTIHPKAVISRSAKIGTGFTALAGAIVNAAASLGENVLVNTGAIVEHDCVIGDHVHIATGARLASTVTVGDGAHVGAGATIRQRIKIGAGALVGAGAVVVNDVPAGTVVVGVPAKPLYAPQTAGAETRPGGNR